MTNSLFKDSHITRPICCPNLYSGGELKNKSNQNKRKEYSSKVTVNNNIGVNINKPADKINFRGLSNAKKGKFNFYTSNKVKWLLEKADEKQVVFSAGFALILTCFLRPASIMALPSDKKNKDDKKYAAAHSIASGVIGFTISSIVANPIGDAVKKVLKDPQKYMPKNAKLLQNKDYWNFASNYANKLPDIIMSVPKGIATIALIPVILKYVFGWEKKKNLENKEVTPHNQNGGVK